MKKFVLFIAVCIVFIQPTKGQVDTPPSLSAGLGGITGAKGLIDVELLGEIIAEKQSELKKEFVKRTIFAKLENKSYVLWNYAYSSIDILLESKDKNVIKKNLIEYSANLALVYGFAEFYLQISNKTCNSGLNNLLIEFNGNEHLFKCSDQSRELSSGLLFKNLKDLKATIGNNEVYFNALFLDIVFDVLINNKEIDDLGFFSNKFPLGEAYYNDKSLYQKVGFSGSTGMKTATAALRARMVGEIKMLTGNFLLLKQIHESNLSLDNLITMVGGEVETLINTRLPVALRNTDRSVQIQALVKELNAATSDIGSALQNLVTDPSKIDSPLSAKIAKNLAAFQRFRSGGRNFEPYDLYFLNESIYPLLVELTTKYGLDAKFLGIAQSYSIVLNDHFLGQLKSDIGTSDFKKLSAQKLSEFKGVVELITSLDELDQVATYDKALRIAQDAANLIPESDVSGLINTVVNTIQKYTTVDADSNRLEIDVEDVILAIYKKYANRRNSWVDLYFSVGLNQSVKTSYSNNVQSPLVSTAGDTLNSVAFAAEKIGLKFKIVNIARRNSFDYGETPTHTLWPKKVSKYRSKEPLVSDVHWLVYGSGLLYNIVNTTTEDEDLFNFPMIGTGPGISFFNSIDFNLWMNIPMVSGESFATSFKRRKIYGFSFDIRISDYLAALNKKRKQNNASKND